MSWRGGTDIMFDTVDSFNEHHVPDYLRRALYIDLIESLNGQDWGNSCDCLGCDPMLDEALEVTNRRWCKKHGYDYDEMFGDGA